jgi:CheY-specific phosphatase CheX
MPSMFFGQFLLEQGAVTSDALLDVLPRQKQIQRPLCALALEQGYLTDEQIDQLDREAEKSGVNRIKHAISKRWITFDRVAQLDQCPFEKWMTLGEALVQEGYLSLAELRDLSTRYRSIRTSNAPTWQAQVGTLKEHVIVSRFLQDMVGVFVRYTEQILTVESVNESFSQVAATSAVAIGQEILGDRRFIFRVELSRDLALSIATYMLKSDPGGLDSIAIDAIMEFVNVVVGNGCSRMGESDCRLTTRPPFQIGATHPANSDITHAAHIRMGTSKGALQVSFLFLDGPR